MKLIKFELILNQGYISCDYCGHFLDANNYFIRLHLKRKDDIGYRVDLCSIECFKEYLEKKEINLNLIKQIGRSGFVKAYPEGRRRILLEAK